jgi:hypothetical protein
MAAYSSRHQIACFKATEGLHPHYREALCHQYSVTITPEDEDGNGSRNFGFSPLNLLTQLVVREDFIIHSRRESSRSYTALLALLALLRCEF